MELGPGNRLVAAWLITAVGFAQLFRSPLEQIIGCGYLFGAVWMAAATIKVNVYWTGVAIGFVAMMFAGRAVSGLFVAATWHGAMIIVATWGGLAAAFMRGSLRTLKGLRVLP